jgi:hypothetical protein
MRRNEAALTRRTAMTSDDLDKVFYIQPAKRYTEPMTSEPPQKQVLAFPYQLATEHDLEDCYDIEVLSFQTRLWATKLITAIQCGQIEPTEAVIRNLTSMNETLKKYGKPELSLDFLK